MMINYLFLRRLPDTCAYVGSYLNTSKNEVAQMHTLHLTNKHYTFENDYRVSPKIRQGLY